MNSVEKKAYDKEYYAKNKEKINAQNRDWKKNNPGYAREKALLDKYNLTLSQYDEMFESQGGDCAICKEPEHKAPRGRFHVDHCHSTGEVRGLLCHHCNTALGGFKDDVYTLASAIKYLSEYNFEEVL